MTVAGQLKVVSYEKLICCPLESMTVSSSRRTRCVDDNIMLLLLLYAVGRVIHSGDEMSCCWP